MVVVGIGTVERANEFCEHVGFPKENLLADPENAAYSALHLKAGVATTFFTESTPFSILARVKEEKKRDDLVNSLQRWKPWIPPKLDQGLQQGGMFVFQGKESAFTHYDPSTGAHADLDEVLTTAVELAR